MYTWSKTKGELIKEIETERNDVSLFFLGQCGFVITYKGKTILIDAVLEDLTTPDGKTRRNYPPLFKGDDLKTDIMIFTHNHKDHLAKASALASYTKNPDIRFVLPKGLKKELTELEIKESNIFPLIKDDSLNIDGVNIFAFSTAHPDHNDDLNLGYAININGKKIVHLGDTYLTEQLHQSLLKLGHIDVLMGPINGDDYYRAKRNCIGNMEAEEFALLCKDLNVGIGVPTHYDMVVGNTADVNRFAVKMKEIDFNSHAKIMQLGELLSL